jgi:cytochrome bd ubiquinol oxidase subunit II
MGLTSAAILAFHGANYLAMKCDGALRARASNISRLSGSAVVGLVVLVFATIPFVQPTFRLNYAAHPIGYVFPFTGIAALAAALQFRRRDGDFAAFGASSLFILSMLASTAWGSYPNILIATTDPANSLTITNAAAGAYGMRAALWWFLSAFTLVIVYQVYVHRVFWGKVTLDKRNS